MPASETPPFSKLGVAGGWRDGFDAADAAELITIQQRAIASEQERARVAATWRTEITAEWRAERRRQTRRAA